MDMSGISKGRIKDRIAALKVELERLAVLVAQYQAAIAELEELLKPEEPQEKEEQPDQSDLVLDFTPKG
jgi:hypothetical protein